MKYLIGFLFTLLTVAILPLVIPNVEYLDNFIYWLLGDLILWTALIMFEIFKR